MLKNRTFRNLRYGTCLAVLCFAIWHFFLNQSLNKNIATRSIPVVIDGKTVLIRTKVVGRGARWDRTIKQNGDHLTVEDSFTGDGQALCGLRISHSMQPAINEAWLGGQKLAELFKNINLKKSPIDFSDPWNPTVFGQFKKDGGGIGLVAEDDVFRQQIRLFYNPFSGETGLKSDMFCVAPAKTYKTRWSIYDSDSNYWEFINRVRNDWHVNHEIEGRFVWFTPDDILAMSPSFLKERLQKQGTRIANMFGGWTDPKLEKAEKQVPMIGFGSAVLLPRFAKLRSRIQSAIKMLKAASPGLKVLLYFDAQRDSSPQAETLFKDSLFLDQNHKTESTNWGGQYSPTLSVFPTLENNYGRRLEEVVAEMKTLGADGVYWDEMESLDYSGVRYTFEHWDGHSCVLDANSKVLSRIGYTNLLSEMAKRKFANIAENLMANSPPTTRYFNDRPDVHMIEGQHFTDYSSYAHLTTPLSYIGTSLDWPSIIKPISKGLLPASVRLDYDTPFFSYLYPFEPMRIYPGAIFGLGKIVSSVNGRIGWSEGCKALKISQFNEKGLLVQPTFASPMAVAPCVSQVKLPRGSVVILEAVWPDGRPSKTSAFVHQFDSP